MFPNPEAFKLERFLDTDNPKLQNFTLHFGFGRRICPGKDLAENTVFAMVSNLFYSFRFTPAVDEKGREIPIPTEFEEHAVRYVSSVLI